MRRLAMTAALMLGAFALHGQSGGPKFEVGTAKVSKPASGGPFSAIPVIPGIRNGVFEARYMPMKMLLAYAYDVSEVQVSGPEWLDKNRYDIQAKVPEGALPSEGRAMLRAFLAERFHVVTHAAVREMDALALVVAEGGHKLHLLEAGDSFQPEYPKDARGLILHRGDMRSWADLVTKVMGTPVIDQTGLKGRYAGAVGYTPFDRVGDGPNEIPVFPVALREQAGLELVKRKMMVEVLVVDRADEDPGEN